MQAASPFQPLDARGLAAAARSRARSLYEGSTRDTFLLPAVTLIALVFLGSVLASALGGAAIVLGAIWVPALYHLMFRVPVATSTRVFLTLALFIESPDETPGNGYWDSPLTAANEALFGALKKLTGLPGLSLPLFFALAVVLLVRGIRSERRARARGEEVLRAPKIAVRAAMVLGAAVVSMEAFGLARGGQIEPSFFQLLHLATLPVVLLAMLYTLRAPEDLRAVGTIVVVCALAKAALVAWVYFVVCLPAGIVPEYCTTHGDSITFDAAVFVLAACWASLPTRRTFLRMALGVSVLLLAMVMNHRRLAFVGLGTGLAVTYLSFPKSRFKRRLTRLGMIAVPLVAIYVAIGASQTGSFYAPAQLVASVITQTDSSSDSRDVENDNLVATLAEHPVTGSGYGFEYVERFKAYDLTEQFALWKFIAHNSVLWILGIGGVVGFACIWVVYALHIFFAARANRFAVTPLERTTTLATLGTTAIVIAMNWGDQGLSSYTNVVVFSAGFALVSKLSVLTERRALAAARRA